MRLKNLRILPIISNFNSSLKDFDGRVLHQVLSDPGTEDKLINQLADTLQFYHLNGINVDFEELIENSNQPLSTFQ
jgi:spore germination protein YaaH